MGILPLYCGVLKRSNVGTRPLPYLPETYIHTYTGQQGTLPTFRCPRCAIYKKQKPRKREHNCQIQQLAKQDAFVRIPHMCPNPPFPFSGITTLTADSRAKYKENLLGVNCNIYNPQFYSCISQQKTHFAQAANSLEINCLAKSVAQLLAPFPAQKQFWFGVYMVIQTLCPHLESRIMCSAFINLRGKSTCKPV